MKTVGSYHTTIPGFYASALENGDFTSFDALDGAERERAEREWADIRAGLERERLDCASRLGIEPNALRALESVGEEQPDGVPELGDGLWGSVAAVAVCYLVDDTAAGAILERTASVQATLQGKRRDGGPPPTPAELAELRIASHAIETGETADADGGSMCSEMLGEATAVEISAYYFDSEGWEAADTIHDWDCGEG